MIASCPIHVATFTLISILATDYIQKRRGEPGLFKFDNKVKVTTWIGHKSLRKSCLERSQYWMFNHGRQTHSDKISDKILAFSLGRVWVKESSK